MFISKLQKMANLIATIKYDQDDIQFSQPKRQKINHLAEFVPKTISHKKPIQRSGSKREQNGQQLHFRGICKSGKT